ncbi:hypothetical protein HDU97_001765 [Phlyctochytrium planicorne]|nr:hypothetical protein HDU97_001765 [Phlyctochytrium planicorne]
MALEEELVTDSDSEYEDEEEEEEESSDDDDEDEVEEEVRHFEVLAFWTETCILEQPVTLRLPDPRIKPKNCRESSNSFQLI